MKRDLAGVGGEWRMRARVMGEVETGGGEGNETGIVTKKKLKKSTIGIGASLIPDGEQQHFDAAECWLYFR